MNDERPLVRGAAIWAMRRLGTAEQAEQLRLAFLPAETDMDVRAEWMAEVQSGVSH